MNLSKLSIVLFVLLFAVTLTASQEISSDQTDTDIDADTDTPADGQETSQVGSQIPPTFTASAPPNQVTETPVITSPQPAPNPGTQVPVKTVAGTTTSPSPSYVPRPSVLSDDASINKSFGFVSALLIITSIIFTQFY